MQAASYITIYAEKAADARARHAIETDARNAAIYADRARHYEVLAQSARESAACDAQRDAAQVEAAQPVPVKVQAPVAKVEAAPAKVRCPHYKLIRKFYVVAKKAGLNCDNKKGMRAAFSAMLGRAIITRADMKAADWSRAIAEVEAAAIWW